MKNVGLESALCSHDVGVGSLPGLRKFERIVARNALLASRAYLAERREMRLGKHVSVRKNARCATQLAANDHSLCPLPFWWGSTTRSFIVDSARHASVDTSRSGRSVQVDGGDQRAGLGCMSGNAGQLDFTNRRDGGDRESLRRAGGMRDG